MLTRQMKQSGLGMELVGQGLALINLMEALYCGVSNAAQCFGGQKRGVWCDEHIGEALEGRQHPVASLDFAGPILLAEV